MKFSTEPTSYHWRTMARLLEHLSTALRHDLEVEAFRRMPWQEFIERTAGILADDPIERLPQLPLANAKHE
ncbi:MAG: hypothetical protein U0521_20945 [Anaerolineae bacterium]